MLHGLVVERQIKSSGDHIVFLHALIGDDHTKWNHCWVHEAAHYE